MKRKIISYSVIICAVFSILFFSSNYFKVSSKIVSTTNLDLIEVALKNSDKETLFIFDVDDVLVTQTDQIFRAERREYFKKIMKEFQQRYTKEQIDKLISIIMLESPVEIVDPKIIRIIQTLQIKNVPVMALTALSTRTFKNKYSFIDWRIDELKKIGISFKDSWKNFKPKHFFNFKTQNVPAFKDGILFSSGNPKGEVLEVFLNHINFRPKKIIFVDDHYENLKNVEYFCSKNNIDYLGFEYTAAKELSHDPIDKERAQRQIYHLENEQRWLSDAQLRKN